MIVNDGNDLLALLVFVPREANPIAPVLATVLVPSPWSTRRSSCFSTARCRTLATNACQSDPSSAHFAVGRDKARCHMVRFLIRRVAGRDCSRPAPSERHVQVSLHAAQALPTPLAERGGATSNGWLWTCLWPLGCRRTRLSVVSLPPCMRQTL